eukprot:TRINITY_DN409_c1_g1_i2.p1 TRINITY_DN409_c1_g1~~TRINITY_DN409_c1_g1_i2.p1  ORF type:complete len:607 (-),score=157.25 TRINITY_DN409_c1_g1_i2:2379-4199(-)
MLSFQSVRPSKRKQPETKKEEEDDDESILQCKEMEGLALPNKINNVPLMNNKNDESNTDVHFNKNNPIFSITNGNTKHINNNNNNNNNNNKKEKRKKEEEKRISLSQRKEKELWVNKYEPKTLEECAIHKNKREEVKEWLKKNDRNQMNFGKEKKILILCGPTGSGKTILTKLVAKELEFEIVEWNNPFSDKSAKNIDGKVMNYSLGSFQNFETSKLDQFREFLLQSRAFPDLFSNGNKVILIKDPPFIHNAKQRQSFCDIIIESERRALFPLIIIRTTEQDWNINNNLILPSLSGISKTIKLNAISQTSMAKVITRIVSAECKPSHSHQVLQQALSHCEGGDIRAAINSAQWLVTGLQGEDHSFNSSKPRKKHMASKDKEAKVNDINGSRDDVLSIFRAVGKVLYNKRLEQKGSERPPAEVPVENIIENLNIEPNVYIQWVQENYLNRCQEIEDVEAISSLMSEFDCNSPPLLMTKESQFSNSLWAIIVCRGYMFHNKHLAANTYSPLCKPSFYEVRAKAMQNKIQSVGSLSPFNLLNQTSGMTEVLSYQSKISKRKFAKLTGVPTRPKAILEGDIVDEEEELIPVFQKPQTSFVLEEDDIMDWE